MSGESPQHKIQQHDLALLETGSTVGPNTELKYHSISCKTKAEYSRGHWRSADNGKGTEIPAASISSLSCKLWKFKRKGSFPFPNSEISENVRV